MSKNIYRESKINDEFLNFFQNYKLKNKDKWSSIINGMDVDTDELSEETFKELEDKYLVMNEIHKRKQLKAGFEAFENITNDKFTEENLKRGRDDLSIPEYKGFSMPNLKKKPSDSLTVSLAPDVNLGEQYDSRKFHLIFLDSDIISNVTPLNRVYHRRVLIFAGNKEGLISYGCGIGLQYEDAYLNAFSELKKNLILIEWDPRKTVPLPIKTRFHDYRLSITPRNKPKWFSGPIPLLMMRYCGFYHQQFIKHSRNKEPYAMVFAFFKAVTQNTTPLKIAEKRGLKKKNIYNNRLDKTSKRDRISFVNLNL